MPDDIDQIKRIADGHKRELGFVRRPSLLEAINRSELFVANQDGNIVGFVEYRHRRDEQTTLYNIVVVGDYRRKGIGEKLVEALIEEAKALNKSFILLKCPEELCANKFYETLNFHLEETEEGKKRQLNIWCYVILNPC